MAGSLVRSESDTDLHTERGPREAHSMEMATHKPRTGTSEEATLDDTLILNL